MQVLLEEQVSLSRVGRPIRFRIGCTGVANDGQGEVNIEVGVSSGSTDASCGGCTHPVVGYRLVCGEDGRVALSDKDIK